MLIDYIRQVHATQKFKIKDNFEFLDFDDITHEDMGDKSVPEHIEIWAAIKINYDGEAPDSYKILNLTIGDWVASHEKDLTKVIHKKLKDHFSVSYPESDTSDVHEESESSIWLDQLDYMPRINEKEKNLIIEIELVLEAEEL
jgi:uncharacterized protein YlxP (DUF503 family)